MKLTLWIFLLKLSTSAFFTNISYSYAVPQNDRVMVFAQNKPIYYSITQAANIKVYQIVDDGISQIANMTWGLPYPVMDIDDSGDLLVVGQNSDIFLYERTGSTFLQLHTYTWVQTVKGITIAGDASRCFVGGNSGAILIIDLVTFTIIQTLPSLGMGRITIINTNQDGTYLAAGYNAGCLAVYKGSTSYVALNGSPITGFSNPKNELITAKNFTLFFMNTISIKVHVFERNETHVWYVKEVDGVDDFAVSEDGGYFAGDVTQIADIYTVEEFIFTPYVSFPLGESLSSLLYDPSGRFLLVSATTTTYLFVLCGQLCLSCSVFVCLECQAGYVLDQGLCVSPYSNDSESQRVEGCVDGAWKSSGRCVQYCEEGCLECWGDRHICSKCKEYYVLNGHSCEVEDMGARIAIYIRPYSNIVRRNWMAPLYLVLEEIWLYNYHKQKYNGTVSNILETIRIIENKKWAIEPLNQLSVVKDFVFSHLPRYTDYSNEKFLQKEHHSEVLAEIFVQYFVFYLPTMFIVFFLLNRLFYALFQYSISSWFRIYSFWGSLWMVSFEGNIQFFSFVLLRTFIIAFSVQFISKVVVAFSAVFGFLLLLYTVVIYHIYKHLYDRLSKYYLNNLFRFKSSFVLMTLIYGYRPLLRGIIHALLYNYQELQLHLLALIEFLTVITLLGFEFIYESHICKFALFFKLLYHITFFILNEHLVLSISNEIPSISQVSDYLVYIMIGSCILGSLSLLLWDRISACSFQTQPEQAEQASRSEIVILHELNGDELFKEIKDPKIHPTLVLDLSNNSYHLELQKKTKGAKSQNEYLNKK